MLGQYRLARLGQAQSGILLHCTIESCKTLCRMPDHTLISIRCCLGHYIRSLLLECTLVYVSLYRRLTLICSTRPCSTRLRHAISFPCSEICAQ